MIEVPYLRDGSWGTDFVDILIHLWTRQLSVLPPTQMGFSYIDVVSTRGEHGPEQPIQLSCPDALAWDFMHVGRFLLVRTHAYGSVLLGGDLKDLAGHWGL